MAQITSFRPYPSFDLHWRPRIGLATAVLAEIQNRWVLHDDDFPVRSTTAVILHVFARGTPIWVKLRGVNSDDPELRPVADWLAAVEDPISECRRFLRSLSPTEHQEIVRQFGAILAQASTAWEDSISSPRCEDVVLKCLHFLTSEKFVLLRR